MALGTREPRLASVVQRNLGTSDMGRRLEVPRLRFTVEVGTPWALARTLLLSFVGNKWDVRHTWTMTSVSTST